MEIAEEFADQVQDRQGFLSGMQNVLSAVQSLPVGQSVSGMSGMEQQKQKEKMLVARREAVYKAVRNVEERFMEAADAMLKDELGEVFE